MLALGSANQLKVSRPMSSASWEHTAAKLHQPHKELKFRSIAFSADGSMLAVLAGTSVFAHLCIYDVDQGDEGSPGAGRSPGKGGGRGGALCHVHEVHPSRSTGAIMQYLWLNETVLAVVFRSSHVRLLMRDRIPSPSPPLTRC